MEKLNNFRWEIKTALQLLTKGWTKTNYQQSDTLPHKKLWIQFMSLFKTNWNHAYDSWWSSSRSSCTSGLQSEWAERNRGWPAWWRVWRTSSSWICRALQVSKEELSLSWKENSACFHFYRFLDSPQTHKNYFTQRKVLQIKMLQTFTTLSQANYSG